MSKRIGAHVRVIEAQSGAPAQFYWSNRWNRVAGIVDSWRESGEWWDGEEEKSYYLVSLASGGCYELCREAPGQWVLSRVPD